MKFNYKTTFAGYKVITHDSLENSITPKENDLGNYFYVERNINEGEKIIFEEAARILGHVGKGSIIHVVKGGIIVEGNVDEGVIILAPSLMYEQNSLEKSPDVIDLTSSVVVWGKVASNVTIISGGPVSLEKGAGNNLLISTKHSFSSKKNIGDNADIQALYVGIRDLGKNSFIDSGTIVKMGNCDYTCQIITRTTIKTNNLEAKAELTAQQRIIVDRKGRSPTLFAEKIEKRMASAIRASSECSKRAVSSLAK